MSKGLRKSYNLRDLSYLVNGEGLSLIKSLFFRGGALKKLKDKEIQYIKDIGITTVIDLRTEGEIHKKPDTVIEGITYHKIPLLEEATLGITHEKGLKGFKAPPHMPDLYASLATNDYSINALRKVFDIIFDPNRKGAIMWHCTAGKDRVGLVSALFLAALGYKEKDIFADYELSDAPSRKKGRWYRVGVFILKWNIKLAQSVYDTMRASPEYLASAFSAIKQRFDSCENFLDFLGVTKQKIEAFKKKFMIKAGE